MNPEIKAKWVAALRSGDYEQGKGFLHITNVKDLDADTEKEVSQFCCLGVLCDVAIKDGIALKVGPVFDQENDHYGPYVKVDARAYNIGYSFPPPEVWQSYADMPDKNPTLVDKDGIEKSLSDINDAPGSSFEQIAALIEEQL